MKGLTVEAGWEIAVVLSPEPRVVTIKKDTPAFDFMGDRFKDIGLGHHNGFYDFLRNLGGRIIGIRYFPDPDAAIALKEARENKGVIRVKEQGSEAFLLFWQRDRDFDPAAMCDQYFGNNFIYRSTRSVNFAIGFGIDALTANERHSIKVVTAN